MELYSKAMWLLRRDIWNWREYAGTLSILKSSLWLVRIPVLCKLTGGHLGIFSQDLRMNLDHLPAGWFRARMLPETCRNHWYPLVKHRISHKEHIFILLFMYLPIPILLEPKHRTVSKSDKLSGAADGTRHWTVATDPVDQVHGTWAPVVAGTKSTNGQECRALRSWHIAEIPFQVGNLGVFFFETRVGNQGVGTNCMEVTLKLWMNWRCGLVKAIFFCQGFEFASDPITTIETETESRKPRTSKQSSWF